MKKDGVNLIFKIILNKILTKVKFNLLEALNFFMKNIYFTLKFLLGFKIISLLLTKP